ncbi:MAG: PucR family transcriptional regulator [Solirubrobacteraceae bacterium]
MDLERPRRELARRALEGLIGPDAGRRAEAARELVDEDLIVPGSVGVLAVGCTDPAALGPEDRTRLGPALEQFRRALPARRSLSLVSDDHALVLVALDAHLLRLGGLAGLARRAHEALEHLAIGFSEPCEQLTDAHRAHEHARLATRVAACAPEHPSPAGWADLGAYRMLAQVAELPGAEGLLHPGLSRLLAQPSSESLVATLETYLDNGCDTKLTAEALFLHRASLYYRLQRIESLIGASLRSGADRLALHASLKLARLLGVHPALRGNRELAA